MPIPQFQSLTLPSLKYAAGKEIQTRELVEVLADQFRLSDDERAETTASGANRFADRVHWAITYLKKAGLVSRVGRGRYAITEQGEAVLKEPPERIDLQFLDQFDGMREFRHGKSREEGPEPDKAVSITSSTPEEEIDSALEELNDALRVELLERIQSMHPTAFERLIIDLMLGMGYGKAGASRHLGRTADGGVDGVINEDALGLDTIYLQAKRYATGSAVGVEKIREFAGSLDERGATKGVFVTTSHFAAPAKQYAQRSPKHLVLLDGEKLTDLLIQFGVAVRTYRKIELRKIDDDYFDDMNV